MGANTRPTPGRLSRLLSILLPILLLAAGVLLYKTLQASRPQPAAITPVEKVWTVRTQSAHMASHQPVLTLYGRVESPRMTRLTAAVTAFVQQVYHDEGQPVRQGVLLIQLDPRDSQLQVQQREADLIAIEAQISAEHIRHQADQNALKIETRLQALSHRAVKRFENLARRKVASEEQLDDARRTLQQQALALNSRQQALNDHPNRLAQLKATRQRRQAELDSARLDLQRTRISAPFDGRIASLQAVPGDRVRSGDPLLSLYNPARLEIRAQVPDRILPAIRKALANPALLSASARLGGRQIHLRLDRLASEVDGGRAGVDALFTVQKPQQLEPGRALPLQLQLPAQHNVIALPPQALYGQSRIYRIIEGRLDGLQVERIGNTTSQNGDTRILVRSPQLQPDDTIVITQLPNAITGLKVKEA